MTKRVISLFTRPLAQLGSSTWSHMATFVPGPDELGQVCIQSMVGHARQGNLIALVILLAGDESDVQIPGDSDGVLSKCLVKVANPE